MECFQSKIMFSITSPFPSLLTELNEAHPLFSTNSYCAFEVKHPVFLEPIPLVLLMLFVLPLLRLGLRYRRHICFALLPNIFGFSNRHLTQKNQPGILDQPTFMIIKARNE